METIEDIRRFLEKGYLEYRSGMTIECAIFGYHQGKLSILLVKNEIITQWCLPSGYIRKTERLDEAASRVTAERTGIENLFLKQFKTFADPGRGDPHGGFNEDRLFQLTGIRIENDNWLNTESIAIGHYAITDIIKTKPKADLISSECRWFPVDDLPLLGFDHGEIVREALFTMRMHLYHFPLGKNFLPEKFTLKEIKLFYEVMSGKQLHATNFTNKLVTIGLIVKLDEKKNIGAHRAPTYYRFDDVVYDKALNEGLVLV